MGGEPLTRPDIFEVTKNFRHDLHLVHERHPHRRRRAAAVQGAEACNPDPRMEGHENMTYLRRGRRLRSADEIYDEASRKWHLLRHVAHRHPVELRHGHGESLVRRLRVLEEAGVVKIADGIRRSFQR